jgi:protease secretion system membrane fusion protein
MNASTPSTGPSETAPAADDLKALSDTRRIARIGLLTLLLGFGGFLLWAALVPLDQGVPTLGTVMLDTKRKVVQHPQGGIVREVLVHEGQQVQAGQVLLRLNEAAPRAAFESVRQQYFSLKALEGRLLAEQLGQPTPRFDEALVQAAKEDPKLAQQMALQTQLLGARWRSYEASMAALRESSAGNQAIIESSGQVEVNRKRQLEIVEKELLGVRDLVREQYASQSRLNELERQTAELRSALAENRSTQARARQSILEMQQRELAMQADRQKDIEQQLTQMRPELQALTERYKAALEDMDRVEIRAPASGQVVGLTVQTVGSVIQAGQRIVDIMPLDDELIVESKIEPQHIDRIRAGDAVDLRFSGFANSTQIVAEGALLSVSADVFSEQGYGAKPYYLARVALTPEGRKTLRGRRLHSGMMVEVVIKTGRRTLLQYLLSPLTRRMAASLKEE